MLWNCALHHALNALERKTQPRHQSWRCQKRFNTNTVSLKIFFSKEGLNNNIDTNISGKERIRMRFWGGTSELRPRKSISLSRFRQENCWNLTDTSHSKLYALVVSCLRDSMRLIALRRRSKCFAAALISAGISTPLLLLESKKMHSLCTIRVGYVHLECGITDWDGVGARSNAQRVDVRIVNGWQWCKNASKQSICAPVTSQYIES